MLSDSGTGEYGMEESLTPESPSPSVIQPIPLPLFAVQLQNILPVEIVAKRFPEDIDHVSTWTDEPTKCSIEYR